MQGPFVRVAVVVLICGLTRKASCETIQDVKDLKASLFENASYDVTIRPINNQAEPICILASLSPLAIHKLDEVTEALTSSGFLEVVWTDENLHWKPELYGGIHTIYLSQNQVWKPDIALKNSLKQYKPLGDESLYVDVGSNGTIVWYPLEVFLSTCTVDLTYFPNDIQTCSFSFVAWTYVKEEVRIEGSDVNLELYESNSAWEVIGTAWREMHHGYETGVIFDLKLKRRPTYSMLTLVIPVITLSALNLFVFALPCESGEKASYAVTVFLAFTVFATIMESSFPHNSETVSYFAIIVIVGTVQSAVITILVLIMVRCSAFGENTKVPACLISLVRFRRCKSLPSKSKKIKVGVAMPREQLHVEDTDTASVEPGTSICVEEKQKPVYDYTWKCCMDSLDAFFFCIFLTTFSISVSIFFLMINNPSTIEV